MVELIYTTYISEELAHHEIFRAKDSLKLVRVVYIEINLDHTDLCMIYINNCL